MKCDFVISRDASEAPCSYMLDKRLMLLVRFFQCLLRVYVCAEFEFYKMYVSVFNGKQSVWDLSACLFPQWA